MKTTKVVIIATIITIILILSCAYALPVQAEAEVLPEFYPKLTIVVKVIQEDGLWIIECMDRNGDLWTFYDEEESWAIGDVANLLMMTINNNIEEDEIIEVYWEGYIENFTEWR